MQENAVSSVHLGFDTFLPFEHATDNYIRFCIAYWRCLRGGRRFPSRANLTLLGLSAVLPYTIVVRVIDGGADFEICYVGDAQARAFTMLAPGIRVSQIESSDPETGDTLRYVYDRTRASRSPFVIRGRLPGTALPPNRRHHETVFLPLGPNDNVVDHVLVVGIRVPQTLWKISEEERTRIAQPVGTTVLIRRQTAPAPIQTGL